MRLHDGKYRCILCGAVLDVPPRQIPDVMIRAVSGSPNVRTIGLAGQEIHACEFAAAKRGQTAVG